MNIVDLEGFPRLLVAQINQAGVAAPTFANGAPLFNSFNGPISLAYVGVGQYSLNFPAATFLLGASGRNFVWAQIARNAAAFLGHVCIDLLSPTAVGIETVNLAGADTDGILATRTAFIYVASLDKR